MIEAIQVIRDVVIILSAVVITTVVVIVGRVVLKLARKVEDMRLVAVDVVNGVMNPVKGVAIAIGRIAGRHKR